MARLATIAAPCQATTLALLYNIGVASFNPSQNPLIFPNFIPDCSAIN